jgi:transcriptional regulator with XRE-family HTH domain
VPAAPLVPLIETRIRRGQFHEVGEDQAPAEDLVKMLGVDYRTFAAWRSGERREVQFDKADRVLTELGVDWGDVYDRADFPEGDRLADQLFGGVWWAAPLVAAIVREQRLGTRSYDQIAQDCRVNPRWAREWRSGRQEFVKAETADKILLGLGLLWWECFDADVYPEAYARAERLFG